jgi:hypothetical protein
MQNHRRELFSNVLNYNAAILSAEDKFVWILSNEDPSCVRELAKFIHSCFQMANIKHFALQELNISQNHFHLPKDAFHLPRAIGQPLMSNPEICQFIFFN